LATESRLVETKPTLVAGVDTSVSSGRLVGA